MQKNCLGWVLSTAALLLTITTAQAEAPAAVEKPVFGEYKDWRVLGVSHRLDKKFVRAILGNDVAIDASRSGKMTPSR
ncbi:MAG: cytochrome P460 family protein [Methylococcaceae bacterium]|nr:cytochrome P460 family protein [Methylococcaceae bacterium]